MMKHFNNNTGHSVSLELVENYFWNIPNLNIYAATVPDRMHHLDLGLYHYQIEFTKGILGRSLIDKMNERIGAIPRYPGLKIFSKGLQSIAQLTASEHRDLMKVMVFVVDGLLSNNLSEVYVKWNEMYILSRLEIFKESDLEKFQKAINEWADLFVILFRKKSDSKMKFSKFHLWIFHIVDTIREYGAINGYTTETYESLHKSYVKTLYRLSNKKGIEEQIMKTIRRKAIIKRRVMEELHKTPTALIYTSKLFEFKLLEASIFFEQQKKNPDLTENMIKGFAKFLECLDSFFYMLDIISAEDCRIKIFGSITLKNINILRAINKFQNRPWFSNIAIAMDDAELFEYQSDNRTCYAQTLLITEVILPNKLPFHLTLVQWYDFKSKKTPFVYGCPLLKLVEIYNFIEIEAIKEIVHIVPRFDTKDEYFHQGEKSYAEQNSGNWWKYTEASIPSSACILSLILYLDATTTDTLGKSSLHPIYISLGNIPTWRRNKEDAKQLLEYFLILFAKNEKEKTSSEFKKLVRETFHKSLKFLLDPLFENENGINYKINNRIIWFFPKISTIIGDWLEACTYLLTYKSASSNFPCYFCLVQKNDLIDTMQDQIILRNRVPQKISESGLIRGSYCYGSGSDLKVQSTDQIESKKMKSEKDSD
ncbi:hypothetical protein Glove_365g188 [Diversispora epigaea]|uniref:Uncharacterized protein n=1 Tax=Diversispora epigaea TaxID=1348612 RepID=A0A397H834_9GLOM|nr:hypothetical protein Glove_365g188 [Diversispora epigaea]